ncbi:MAG: peptide chain release factor 2 [Candidatus Borkfalkiaceae bacterium]|nr:peptide chain release factor 2 [Christensenellaceae bacterium]
MLRIDLYTQKIRQLRDTLKEAGYSLDVDNLRAEQKNLEAQLELPEVWGDLERSTQISRKLTHIKNRLAVFDKTTQAVDDVETLLELVAEEGDESYAAEIEENLEKAEKDIEDLRLQTLLKGKYDALNAIMTLHSGAGGTEACDWTEMLYRMYICYSEKHGYKLTELDRVDGDEAGIKSVTFKVEGDNAYGYLKAEKGVHRLVRISPFDANSRRHTSFSSVEVMPEIDDTEEIVIRPEELKVDTYRSSGAGGQHVNKTESAIRITHLPTGIIVACQNERSQVQNREQAMKMLMSKLIEKRESERMEEAASIKGEMKKIEWGSQIRSYVFCPYTMVKDHRTGCETGNIDAVMNGELDPFIIDYLKKS